MPRPWRFGGKTLIHAFSKHSNESYRSIFSHDSLSSFSVTSIRFLFTRPISSLTSLSNHHNDCDNIRHVQTLTQDECKVYSNVFSNAKVQENASTNNLKSSFFHFQNHLYIAPCWSYPSRTNQRLFSIKINTNRTKPVFSNDDSRHITKETNNETNNETIIETNNETKIESSNETNNEKNNEMNKEAKEEKIILYKGRWMIPFRLVVRLKIIQLIGVASLSIPIVQYTNQGNVSVATMASVGFVIFGSVAASFALWYYTSRYVGELSLLRVKPSNSSQGPNGVQNQTPSHSQNQSQTKVRLSTLDFWGKRQDLDVDMNDIIPPLKNLSPSELAKIAQDVFLPLDVIGKRQFILSLKYGILPNRTLLFDFLYGKMKKKLEE